MSTVISVRLNDTDAKLLTKAAAEQGLSLSEYTKATLFDRAEDLFDLISLKRELAHLERHPEQLHPFEELEAEYANL